MAITFVGFASAFDNAAGTTLTISVPTGTSNGDLMIAFLFAPSSGVIPPSLETGWVDDGIPPATIVQVRESRAMHRFASGEPASYTFDWSANPGERQGYICAYRGISVYTVDTLSFGESAGAGSQAVVRAAQTNPVGAKELLIHQPVIGRTQFGAAVDFALDGALTLRGATGITNAQIDVAASDEIYNNVADFPARTQTVNDGGGNVWGMAGMLRPISLQVVAAPDAWAWLG